MSETVLSQIEQSILKLTVDEQRRLISRVSSRLRKESGIQPDFEKELARMAGDEDIQNELREIEADFRHTEFDGLAE